MTDVITTPGVRLSDAAIRRRMIADFWFYFRQNRGAVIGLAVFILLVLVAIFAPILAPHDPTQQYRDALLVPPVWQEGGRAAFFFGTDAVGRDMLSRLIYGAQYSLFIGIVVVSIALVGGIVIGLVAGFFGGWVDTVIMRVMDVILAFPSLLLAIGLVSVMGTGMLPVVLAISLSDVPRFIRLQRSLVLGLRSRAYIDAARTVKASQMWLMTRHIIPNTLAPLLVAASIAAANAILVEAGLSFLGLGIMPPAPSLGNLIRDGQTYLEQAWWISTLPGAVILLIAISLHFLSDGIRQVLDPRSRK